MILAETERILTGAWKLPSDQKDKIVKRLLYRWHPDKNLDNVSLANEVFKHLKTLIAKLVEENPEKEEVRRRSSASSDTEHGGISNFYSGSRFNSFNENLQKRAQRYRSQDNIRPERQSMRNFNERNPNNYRDYFRDIRTAPNPQSQEAKRWLKQAEHDLENAVNDEGRAYDWKCKKCYR